MGNSALKILHFPRDMPSSKFIDFQTLFHPNYTET